MAATVVQELYGTTIAFASGFLAEITRVSFGGLKRKALDGTHTTSPANRMEFVPADLVDPGTLEVELNFVPDAAPPIDSAPEAITITWPDGTIWSMTGFLTDYKPQGSIGEKLSASVTLQLTGALTIS